MNRSSTASTDPKDVGSHCGFDARPAGEGGQDQHRAATAITDPAQWRLRSHRFLAALVIAMPLLACQRLDAYAERFPRIEIGDTRARVLEIMGPPSSISSLEAPLFSATQMAWRSAASHRVYTVHTVMDRVVTKSVIQ